MSDQREIGSADIACAVVTFNRFPGLSAAARRVGIELMSFLNRHTKRCDPGEALIAHRLGLTARSIRKGKSELKAAGLVSWTSHGGHYATSAYEFNWTLMRAFADESGSSKPADTSEKAETGTPVPTGPSGPVQQERTFQEIYPRTYKRALKEEELKKEELAFGSSGISTRMRAQFKWDEDLMAYCRENGLSFASLAAKITTEHSNRATEAELAKPGGGLAFLLRTLTVEVD
jgi:hypothetical protein